MDQLRFWINLDRNLDHNSNNQNFDSFFITLQRTMKSVCYHNVYNALYGSESIPSDAMNMLKMCKNSRERFWVSKHLMKITKTQAIRYKFDSNDVKHFESINKLSALECRLQLRTVQHAIIKHLHRPGSNIQKKASKEFSNEFSKLTEFLLSQRH